MRAPLALHSIVWHRVISMTELWHPNYKRGSWSIQPSASDATEAYIDI
jgi:hypothetical protein